MIDLKETRLDSLLSEGAEAPSERLQGRVAAMAADYDMAAPVRRVRVRKLRFAFVASCAAAAVVLVTTLSPSIVRAGGLERIQKAMDGAKTMHLKMVSPLGEPSGQGQYEVWYQDGCWRIDFNGTVTIWRDGDRSVFDPKSNTVTKERKPNGPFDHGMRGFKITEMLGSAGLVGASATQRTAGNGLTYTVSMDNNPVKEHYVFTVDSKTDLPIVMHCQKMENGQWVTKIDERFDFNKPLPASLFDLKLPTGAKLVDADSERHKVAADLSKTVATWSVGPQRKFVIHDIEANLRGDVFIVYSGASRSMAEWFDMKDQDGNRYIRADIGSLGNFTDRSIELAEGRTVNFQWWVPVRGLGSLKPVRLHLELIKGLHQRLKQPGAFTIVGNKTLGSYDFHIDRATTPDLPFYLGTLSSPELPENALEIKRGEAYSLCHFLQTRWLGPKGSPIDDPRMSFFTAASGNHRDHKALEEALGWAREELHVANQMNDAAAESTALSDLYMSAWLLDRIQEANGYWDRLHQLSPASADSAKEAMTFEADRGEATRP